MVVYQLQLVPSLHYCNLPNTRICQLGGFLFLRQWKCANGNLFGLQKGSVVVHKG